MSLKLREQTTTFIFGLATILLLTSSVITMLALDNIFIEADKNNEYLNTLKLHLVIEVINFIISFLAIAVICSFNNFLTRSLPNLIGAFKKVKIVSVLFNFRYFMYYLLMKFYSSALLYI